MIKSNEMTRRKMLARVGLTAGAVYLAPTFTTLSQANASTGASAASASAGSPASASAGSTASASAGSGASVSSGASDAESDVGGLIGLLQRKWRERQRNQP